MKTNAVLSTTAVLLSLVTCFAGRPAMAGPEDEARARRTFLENLGFDDVPAVIREKLQRKDYHSELNRRQMQANAVAYEILNATRELSVFILNEVAPNGLDASSPQAAELARFTAKMLALKPLAPPTDYPSDIMLMAEGDARDQALIDWLHNERVRAMDLHKARLLSDIMSLVGGRQGVANEAQIRKVDRLLTTIIDRMYLDDTIGNGKYFGRAMAALLVREEKVRSSGDELSKLMSQELKTHFNMRLENYVGDTVVIPTDKGDQTYKVENGTMMLTRYLAPGSLQISWAAIPAKLSARWKARREGLIGNPLAGSLFVTPEDTAEGITLKMRIRDRIAQGGFLREGFSHIVYYEVKEDPATGIKMARIIDNYPNRVFDQTNEYIRTGGTRLTFPEQVIDPAHHAAVYFANPVPEKVQELSRKSREKDGYHAEFFPSVEVELKDGVIPQNNDHVEYWKTTITEAEYNRVHSEKDAKKLSNDIFARYARGLEQTVYEGWVFHWPDPYDFYLVGATYCSQLGDMVMRRFVGMPLEETPSAWHWILRFYANVGRVGEQLKSVPGMKSLGEKLLALPNVGKAMKLTAIKIISPSSLATQPFMEGKFFRFGSRTPEQRAQSTYLANDYRETDAELTREIQRRYDLIQFGSRPRNIILDAGAAMRDLEYGIVMRATHGMTTKGFTAERFAELAVEEVKPKYKAAAEQAASGLRCEAAFALGH